MKRMWIAAVMLLVVSASALATPPQVDWGAAESNPPVKEAPTGIPNPPPPGVLVGGDNRGVATPILGLPYTDGGNTCGFADDYTPTCAFSSAPDVVYAYRPTSNECVDVSLCGSSYDTILRIVNGTTLAEVACIDDACGLQSELLNVSLAGGTTYYIEIDGYSTNCGDYILNVAQCPPPCDTVCPPGAIREPEPNCGTDYVDTYNGGCNSTPYVFTPIMCNDTGVAICGTYGNYTYTGLNYRDTDWYEIVLDRTLTITYCICGTGPTQALIINGNHGCPVTGSDILASGTAPAGQLLCISATLSAGTYWLWAGTSGFTGTPCGSPYVATITGYDCPPVAVESANWGQMKTLYR